MKQKDINTGMFLPSTFELYDPLEADNQDTIDYLNKHLKQANAGYKLYHGKPLNEEDKEAIFLHLLHGYMFYCQSEDFQRIDHPLNEKNYSQRRGPSCLLYLDKWDFDSGEALFWQEVRQRNLLSSEATYIYVTNEKHDLYCLFFYGKKLEEKEKIVGKVASPLSLTILITQLRDKLTKRKSEWLTEKK